MSRRFLGFASSALALSVAACSSSSRSPAATAVDEAVLQKASLDMFENGVEAAAATAVVVQDAAAVLNPPVVHLNRPFVISIVDGTGAVLFLGHVADPTDAGSP